MSKFILGVVVGGIGLAFLSGVGQSLWTAAERQLNARWSARKEQWEARAMAVQEARDTAAAEEARMEERSRLEDERIGARFRRRYTAEDAGTILTVVDLGDRDWRKAVLCEEVAPPDRVPTAHDSDFRRCNFRWSDLTQAASAQRHMTARVILNSFDDGDGWLTYERLEPWPAGHR